MAARSLLSQGGGGSQIMGDDGQVEVESVGFQASVAHTLEAIAPFEHREGPLDGAAHAADQFVVQALPG